MEAVADDRDYRRGPGRSLQRDKRAIADGEAVFRSGFEIGRLPAGKDCDHCAAGANRIKMKRQNVHYVGRRIIVCTRD